MIVKATETQHTDRIMTALRRDRAAVDILKGTSAKILHNGLTTYVNTADVKLTCCVWRKRSSPKQAMMTAATLIPPAPV